MPFRSVFSKFNTNTVLAFCFLALLSLSMGACHAQPPETTPSYTPIPPKREFRGVWIATVHNIDWPSQKNLTSAQQRREFSEVLDFHKGLGLNAVFVQVRAAGDAFYAKSKEPWSEWLTGQQGLAPSPFYDPLEFMVEESHKRGMEFHAWLNLNRLTHKTAKSVSPLNLSRTKPDWILTYDGMKLFNFGLPEVRQYIVDMTVNIARHYDVDGIHFDDYFYPYTVAGQVLRDDATYQKYGAGFKNKNDWRRNNIDQLVQAIHLALEKENPRLKFGISPFGVWRNRRDDPNGSDTYGGQTSYDNLYADTRKWLQEGWIDYVVPQVYFSSGFAKVPYRNLVDWWAQNSFGRHLYVGQGAYRVGFTDSDKNWQNRSEIPNQVRYLRQKNSQGSVFFSSRSLRANPLYITDSLRQNLYKYPALIPTMPWKDNTPPLVPVNAEAKSSSMGTVLLSWEEPKAAPDGDMPWYYVVYRFGEDEKPSANDPRRIIGIVRGERNFLDTTLKPGQNYLYYITAVDRLHNESRPAGPLEVSLGGAVLKPSSDSNE
jgi:uncharacterized lipoprotein YddW (UPF0748 family)